MMADACIDVAVVSASAIVAVGRSMPSEISAGRPGSPSCRACRGISFSIAMNDEILRQAQDDEEATARQILSPHAARRLLLASDYALRRSL
jgi:hypothetical protein